VTGREAGQLGWRLQPPAFTPKVPAHAKPVNLSEETRKIEKMVHFGAFWCMSQAKPSILSEFRGLSRANVALSIHKKRRIWCIVVHVERLGAQA